MKLIDKINDNPNQKYTVVTEDNNTFILNLVYLPTQQRWSMGLQYGTLTINTFLLTVGPNIIRSFKNVIPFGIAVVSTDGLDPYYLNDFETGRVKFYTLSAADVLAVEAALFA